jgi:histone H3/H4
MKGAWYRWFVVSGTSGTRITKRRGRVNIQREPARDFVKQVVTETIVQARAIEALNKTIQAFLDGTIKYKGRKGK